ncbi:MAG: hypothetical protein KC492_31255, partial [Myxococcales bacterium]|nr:hypothetical protein [Myxococcales bacterium]
MLPTNLPSVRDLLLQAEHWFPSSRSLLDRARPTWRTALPIVLSLGVLAAIPHTLHAEASAAEAQVATEGKPSEPPTAAVILASTGADTSIPTTEPKAPKVDLGHVRYDQGKAFAKTDDGSEAELTIDPRVQHGAERLLRRAHPVRGAIILTDIRTGKVIAVADASHDKSADGRVAFAFAAPTASLFKMVTAAALLEHARVSPKLRVCTDGGHRRIERKHLEPAKGAHALCAPFSSALGHSRNAVFAQLATRFLMHDQLAETAERFGFNRDLPFSQKAIVGHSEIPYNDL